MGTDEAYDQGLHTQNQISKWAAFVKNHVENSHPGPQTSKLWINLDYPLKLVRIHELLHTETNHSYQENLNLQMRHHHGLKGMHGPS